MVGPEPGGSAGLTLAPTTKSDSAQGAEPCKLGKKIGALQETTKKKTLTRDGCELRWREESLMRGLVVTSFFMNLTLIGAGVVLVFFCFSYSFNKLMLFVLHLSANRAKIFRRE